ncbi:response regulator [Larkinella soli]|uniref:response regulator n=1 Tax=Larkinella soli TaxID=1770527 RepID=UPI000FFB5C87|nr:response regulator [Larkinella soli]
MEGKRFVIVLVDDDEDDQFLMQYIVDMYCQDCHLLSFSSASSFDAYRKETAQLPTLILLDLNIPDRSGYELLWELNQDSYWQPIPVLIYSDSDDQQKILHCYQAYANAVVHKPENVERMKIFMDGLRNFWFGCVSLPIVVEPSAGSGH